MNGAIERIRAELSIARAWALLGLRGVPARECRSPFRDDKTPSFSVYTQSGWERWFDHGTGFGGDVVDLWARAKGLSVKDAVRDILCQMPHLDGLLEAPNRPQEAVSPQAGIRWPGDIRAPLAAECVALGALRGLYAGAFALAGGLGTLRIATVYNQKCWLTLDRAERAVSARRFDGEVFPNGKKSFALPGSRKDWPVGLRTLNPELDRLKNIVMVEGEPDYFAGLELALESEINFRVCARLGANVPPISQGASADFRNATVIVIPHNDRSGVGEERARLWVKEILALGAKDCFLQKLPLVCDDLNDFLIQRPDAGPQLLKGFQDGPSPGQKK